MEDEPEFQADDGSGIAKPMWVMHDVARHEDDKMDEVEKDIVEDVVHYMMVKFKYTQLELGSMILDELYGKIDERW